MNIFTIFCSAPPLYQGCFWHLYINAICIYMSPTVSSMYVEWSMEVQGVIILKCYCNSPVLVGVNSAEHGREITPDGQHYEQPQI